MIIRERSEEDRGWIVELLMERWRATAVAIHGETIDLLTLPALVAVEAQGLATYRVADGEAELVSLDAALPGNGIGTALLDALAVKLSQLQVTSLWVTTTNDNLEALRFYQRRGFELRRLRPRAVEQARLLKPTIPLIGDNGIPIRDELDLCRVFGRQ